MHPSKWLAYAHPHGRDRYGDNALDTLAGVPAIVANKVAIDSVAPPSVPASPALILLEHGSVESRSEGVGVTLMDAAAGQ